MFTEGLQVAIGLITTVDNHFLESIVDNINNSNLIGNTNSPRRIRGELEPIVYTSLKGWLFMNYILISCLMVLPILVVRYLVG